MQNFTTWILKITKFANLYVCFYGKEQRKGENKDFAKWLMSKKSPTHKKRKRKIAKIL